MIMTRPLISDFVDTNWCAYRENLKVIGITASNTWGLFLLVLLYGYGLVDVPRSIWQSSYTHLLLQQTYFKIAKISMESSEAQEKYEDTLEVSWCNQGVCRNVTTSIQFIILLRQKVTSQYSTARINM